METFTRDHRRPVYADERNEFRQMRSHAPQLHPQQRFESYDAAYLEEIPSGPIRLRRRTPMPQYYEEESTSCLDNYRTYQSSEPESGPKPLLAPETIEKLRANLHVVSQRINRQENHDEDPYDDRYETRYRDRYEDRYQDRYEDRYQDRYEDRYQDRCDDRHPDRCDDRHPDRYDDRYQDRYDYRYPDRYDDRYEDRYNDRHDDQYKEVCVRESDRYESRQGASSVSRKVLDPNEYEHEEEVTKKTIEEIIMVAQALREKLEHREEVAPMPEHRAPEIEFTPMPEHRTPTLEFTPMPEDRAPMIEFAPMPEHRASMIEFYDESSEPVHPQRRPPLLKTPSILPKVLPLLLSKVPAKVQPRVPIKVPAKVQPRVLLKAPPKVSPKIPQKILPNAPPKVPLKVVPKAPLTNLNPPSSTEISESTGKSTAKIPSLLKIKPKIPSLLEIHVEPPPEIEYVQENIEPYNRYMEPRSRDICWNCNKIGHRHEVCWFPPKEFCYRCGLQGYNDETCPNCP